MAVLTPIIALLLFIGQGPLRRALAAVDDEGQGAAPERPELAGLAPAPQAQPQG
jgi:hypothetical protein